MHRIPSLTALRTFEAVGRFASIKAAAQELGVTSAAVTHQLRVLEEELRTELINRAAKSLTLTKAGEELFETLAGAFSAIDATARRIKEGAGKHVLQIDSLPSFASCWLVPRLSSFYAENPDVEIEINTVGDLGYPAAVARTANSVAIRVGRSAPQWPGLTCEELVHEDMFPVCAPSLLAGPVALREPRDLAAHTLLIVSRRPEGWPEWLAAASQNGDLAADIDPDHGRKFDTIQMATTAAIEGMGVVIGRKPLIDLYLGAGLLVEPFKLRIPSKSSYWLVTRATHPEAPLVQAFRCWLRRALGLPAAEAAVAT